MRKDDVTVVILDDELLVRGVRGGTINWALNSSLIPSNEGVDGWENGGRMSSIKYKL